MLRSPLGQPRGSEKDSFENAAHHLFALAADGEVIGCGRVHGCGPHIAQIRYVASRDDRRGQGIGKAIIAELEKLAAADGVEEIVMNARDPVVSFYERLGYSVTGPGPTLYGQVEQKRMAKRLGGRVSTTA